MKNTAEIFNDEGDIRIPADICKKLGVSKGGKVLFEIDGENILLYNANVKALKRLQEAFKGEAERVGWKDEEDVITYCSELRRERCRKNCENND